jgi:heme/copper-type cytochrome/quinol oxidase subunit 3
MTTAAAATTTSAPEPASFPGVARGKLGMWVFLVTDAMAFGGLWIAYGVLRVRADVWPDPYERLAIPVAAALTVALLGSSLAMSLAVLGARTKRPRMRAGGLAAALLLGTAFLVGQAFEYHHLAAGMGLARDTFASTFYALTGYHGLHVLAGVIILGTLLARRVTDPRTLELGALFWHFVDVAWVPIFTFVYLLPTR